MVLSDDTTFDATFGTGMLKSVGYIEGIVTTRRTRSQRQRFILSSVQESTPRRVCRAVSITLASIR